MVRFPSLPLLLAALLVLAADAPGSTLVLSQLSSDETPAELLDAALVFQISGANELTLRVRNQTAAPDAYQLREIFFNAGSDVASLALVSATSSVDGVVTGDWKLDLSVRADGFGVFGFGLLGARGNSRNEIAPAESVDFVFSFDPGPVDMSDFGSELSRIPPGTTPALAAVKFVSGPGDDSAFGAVVPEPLTVLQVALGLGGLSWASRRRRAASPAGPPC